MYGKRTRTTHGSLVTICAIVLAVLAMTMCDGSGGPQVTSGSPSQGRSSDSSTVDDSISSDAVSGCYALRTGDWEPSRYREILALHVPPLEVRLYPSQSEVDSTWYRLIPRLGATFDDVALWRPYRSDSVHLAWGNGFAGLDMKLHVIGDSLHGFTYAWTDDARPDRGRPTAEVSGSSISCPADSSPGLGPGDNSASG